MNIIWIFRLPAIPVSRLSSGRLREIRPLMIFCLCSCVVVFNMRIHMNIIIICVYIYIYIYYVIMCVYIYIYIYVYLFIHTHIHTYTHTCQLLSRRPASPREPAAAWKLDMTTNLDLINDKEANAHISRFSIHVFVSTLKQ